MTDSFETKIRAAVQSIEPAPEFSENLWKRIERSSRPASAPSVWKRWFFAPTAVCTLVLFLALAFPQSVMAAVRNLIAYLPGIGFVQNDETTLYLPEPLTVAQDGLTLTIEQVVADVNNTVVSYHIDGITADQASACFYDGNRLLLPDDKSLQPTGGGVQGNQARVEFAPLPEGVNAATLLVSMDFPDPACTAPDEWRVDFTLGKNAPQAEMMVVIESPESNIPPSTTTSHAVEVSAEPVESDIQFIVEQVALLTDRYLLKGRITWANESWRNIVIDMESVYAVDAAGNHIAVEPTTEGTKDNEFGFIIASKDFSAPLTLHIENLLVWADPENFPTFSFDAGSDPQAGQRWELNKELELAGQTITIHNASVVQGAQDDVSSFSGAPGYSFEISTAAQSNAMVWCDGQEKGTMGGGGEVLPLENGRELVTTYYMGKLPCGEMTCKFIDFHFQLPGSWQFEWQPPAVAQ